MFRKLSVGAALLAAGTLLTTALAAATPAAEAQPLPGFHDGYVRNDGLLTHYVVGGHGPAIVLLHGWPETWFAWSKVMPELARDHTVVAVDTRGLGDSQPGGTDYTSLTLATDIRAVVTKLGLGKVTMVGHDWGAQIALAYAVRYRADVSRLAILEAPATSTYLQLVKENPDLLWWDSFTIGTAKGQAEALVQGRERIFYEPIYANSAGAITPDEVDRYVRAYSRPGSTHAGFEYFRQQNVGLPAVDAQIAKDGKLTIPTLGIGGEHGTNALVGKSLSNVAVNTATAVVPNTNHWVMDEAPAAVAKLLEDFAR